MPRATIKQLRDQVGEAKAVANGTNTKIIRRLAMKQARALQQCVELRVEEQRIQSLIDADPADLGNRQKVARAFYLTMIENDLDEGVVQELFEDFVEQLQLIFNR